MPETPHYVSDKIDRILDRLNGSWDLELPRLHGKDLQRAGNEATDLARKCSFRIRYLCYRSSHSSIDNTIDNTIIDFETQAKTIFTEWVFKPSQERGTLPSMPVAQSFLKRDMLSRRKQDVTPELRKKLLELLSGLLEEEYNLAQMSPCYERTSRQMPSNSTSRNTSFATAATEPLDSSKQDLSPTRHASRSLTSSTVKRRQTSGEGQVGKPPSKRLQRPESEQSSNQMSSYFKHSKPIAKPGPKQDLPAKADPAKQVQQHEHTSQQIPQQFVSSFDTSASPVPSVFSRVSSNCSLVSGDISFAESKSEASQDYLPSQDGRDMLEDESFQSVLKSFDSTPPKPIFSFDNLDATTPFRGFDPLPGDMRFWLRWEIYRLAQSTELPIGIFQGSIERQHPRSPPSYAQFWAIATTICRNCHKELPAKSDIREWMEQTTRYGSPEGKTAYFTLTLHYIRERGPYLWKLVLDPIKVDKGNRIHRKYGADRHVTCRLEYFDQSRLPKWVTKERGFDEVIAYDSIVTWLATEFHEFAGRKWRAFYLEPEDSKARRKADLPPRLKLEFFAVDGVDMIMPKMSSPQYYAPVPFEQFLNWHIPLKDNLDSTNLKLFSRFGLGLSKTQSTVILKPDQFRLAPDVEPVMNDGCALMSVGMARAVWAICGDGSNDIPSTFQGRISGAKGLWIVDYRDSEITGDQTSIWIEVSDSQLKIKPHPRYRIHADETQRSFEVLKWSSPCKRGHLNIQLINILIDRGISRSTLARLVLNDLEEYVEASRGAMRDPRLLQAWLQEYHSGGGRGQSASFDLGLPDTIQARVAFLVQSGFDAEHCNFLRTSFRSLMKQKLADYADKLRIEIPHSTSAFCIPDPYGVLAEDEIHLGFSSLWENPVTGLKEIALDGVDILVSRNPAALASDIQKRKAVYKHELRHFKDVIVFPTTGSVPLASLLSGGDYDGDTVTAIWEPELVNCFRNVEKPELPDEERCGLQKVSRKLRDAITELPVTKRAVNEFLLTSISFNARPNVLGLCTTAHEELVYSGLRLSDRGPILLATLAGYLVDASKQGLFMSNEKFNEMCGRAAGGFVSKKPAYKSKTEQIPRLQNEQCRNIIDHLMFDVALGRVDSVLEEFENMFDEQKYDRALTGPWRRENYRGKDENNAENGVVALVLKDLKLKLEEANDLWKRRLSKKQKEKNGPAVCQKRDTLQDLENDSLAVDIQYIHGLISEIEPLQSDCDIYREFVREKEWAETDSTGNGKTYKGSAWSLLRASAMYNLPSWRSSAMMWYVAGDELARIKARSLGPTRELVPAMHHILKADCKLIKTLVGESLDCDDEDLED